MSANELWFLLHKLANAADEEAALQEQAAAKNADGAREKRALAETLRRHAASLAKGTKVPRRRERA